MDCKTGLQNSPHSNFKNLILAEKKFGVFMFDSFGGFYLRGILIFKKSLFLTWPI